MGQVFSIVVAVIVGMLMGAAVHYLLRALGLEVTTPGAIVATAIATAGTCQVRWVFTGDGKE